MVKPAALMLGGKELPWVETATHLGHELHESGSMEHDAKVKRAEFIDKSVEIRETLKFASPVEVLHTLTVYCSSFYGCMLWDLSGVGASQVYNAWNMATKLTWDCPRETRRYLLQQVLSCDLITAKTDIMVRYSKFFKSLRSSTSREVATLAYLVSRDVQSTTGANLRLIEQEAGLSVWNASQEKLKDAIQQKERVPVDDREQWRIPFLSKLLGRRQELSYLGEDIEEISDLINSLCIN